MKLLSSAPDAGVGPGCGHAMSQPGFVGLSLSPCPVPVLCSSSTEHLQRGGTQQSCFSSRLLMLQSFGVVQYLLGGDKVAV